MFDNKWTIGSIHFSLEQFPSRYFETLGIKPISVIVDQDVGQETILLITEQEDRTELFRNIDSTQLMLNAGLINTAYGPVFFLVFYFPRNPSTGERPAYELTINPKNPKHLSIIEQLANQKYLHVIVADEFRQIYNSYEFPNSYNLSETIEQVNQICENLEGIDFFLAKAQYESTYTIEQLIDM